MLRQALLSTALLSTGLILVGCASARTSELLLEDASIPRASAPSPVVAAPGATTEAGFALTALPDPAAEAAPAAAPEPTALWLPGPAEGEGVYGSRFTLKGGYWGSTEDALDDGYIFGVSWMKFMSRILALEFELGYLDANGKDAGVDVDVWAMPIMINGRLNLPVWILDVYGGLGVGTIYYDAKASGALSGSDDGFLLGGNAFLGATINLADRISLGLEGKYYGTEDAEDVDTGLDAFALMLTLGFSR